MTEKKPGVGGAKIFNNKNQIVYENSKNKIRKNKTNITSNSKFNRKRNFAEVRQIKRGFRHLLQSSDDKKRNKNSKKINTKFQGKNITKKRCRKSSFSSSSLNSWDSIEERLSLLEKIINYNYIKNIENAADSDYDHDDYYFGENISLLESELKVDDMRRGHQHHPRFSGQRKSNVVIEDVLAALNKHDVLSSSAIRAGDDEGSTSGRTKYITSESSSNSSSFYMDKSLDEHSMSAPTAKPLDLNKNLEQVTKTLSSNNNIITPTEIDHNNESANIGLTATDNPKNSKHKSKLSHKKKSSKSEKISSDKKREKKIRNIGLPEGSQSLSILDDDLETEELAKLRCTSERAEVVAERENRRNKNRSADYPGLAFGGSIFSSDTMMKFNIIRNELHNIMKSQLKRVITKILTFH